MIVNSKNNGTLLIELVLCLFIFSLVTPSLFLLFRFHHSHLNRLQETVFFHTEWDFVYDVLKHDIRRARSITVSDSDSDSDFLSIISESGKQIDFSLSKRRLKRVVNQSSTRYLYDYLNCTSFSAQLSHGLLTLSFDFLSFKKTVSFFCNEVGLGDD